MPDKNRSSTSSDDAELATPSEAANYLRTTPAKLAQDRYHGIGPTYVKLRGRVLYPWAELKAVRRDQQDHTETAITWLISDPLPGRLSKSSVGRGLKAIEWSRRVGIESCIGAAIFEAVRKGREMATIEPYSTTAYMKSCGPDVGDCRKQGHTKYRVRYRKPDGKQTTKRYKLEREAKAFAATVEVQKMEGAYIAPAMGRAKLEDFWPSWHAGQLDIKESWRTRIESIWRVHLQPQWGHRQVASIEPHEIQEWIGTLRRAASTIHDIVCARTTVR